MGNLVSSLSYDMDSYGNVSEINPTVVNLSYSNNNWKEQLTAYNGNTITYDDCGNPNNSYNGNTLEWMRGRLLKTVHVTNSLKYCYEYDENGYRISKKAIYNDIDNGAKTCYEWEQGKLIREYTLNNVGVINTDKWYLYNDEDEIVGVDYTYTSGVNLTVSKRVYYKKDIDGSVIGLLDENGNQFASYSYDVWGNVVHSSYSDNFDIFYTNYIKYKGYYMDHETGYYCLADGYYVPKTGKMLNINKPSDIIDRVQTVDIYNTSGNTYSNYINTLIPSDEVGCNVKYWVDEEVGVCDTDDRWFENMSIFNTNCYGYAVNCWGYLENSRVNVGIASGKNLNSYATTQEIAQIVKSDFQNWGYDVIILSGDNNNPFYQTDNNHELIALRTMSYLYYNALGRNFIVDLYHFMVRKNGKWYFKCGSKGEIMTLKGNNTPETIKWYMYIRENGVYQKYLNEFDLPNGYYDSETQYIVIPKTAIRIY